MTHSLSWRVFLTLLVVQALISSVSSRAESGSEFLTKTNQISVNKTNDNEDAEEKDLVEEGVSSREEGRAPNALSPQNSSTATAVTTKATLLPPGTEEKIYEGSTNVEGASLARKKIIEEATQKTSEEMVLSIMGEARFKKNKSIIIDKIFRQASRYIPVIKTGDLIKTPEGQKLTVTLQVNSKLLESMLQDNGLLYDNETAPMILPFIVIEDQLNNENYRWWRTPNSQRLLSLNEYLEKQLQASFFSSGFFIQRPEAAQWGLLVPALLQQDFLSPEQIQILAKRWSIPIVLTGDLRIKKDEISGEILLDLQLSVTQVSSGRVLAQLNRQNRLPKSETVESLSVKKNFSFVVQAFKDLNGQMQEAWQKGFLSSTLVRLEVQGPLFLNKYDLFKNALKQSNRSIRQVKERLISGQSVGFELEINGSVNDFISNFKSVNLGDRIYKFKGTDSQGQIKLAPEQ